MTVKRVPLLGLVFALIFGALAPPLVPVAIARGVEARLTVVPATAPAGETIAVAGHGFGPHEPFDAIVITPAGQALPLATIGSTPPTMAIDGERAPTPLSADGRGDVAFSLPTVANYQRGSWAIVARGRETGRESRGALTLVEPVQPRAPFGAGAQAAGTPPATPGATGPAGASPAAGSSPATPATAVIVTATPTAPAPAATPAPWSTVTPSPAPTAPPEPTLPATPPAPFATLPPAPPPTVAPPTLAPPLTTPTPPPTATPTVPDTPESPTPVMPITPAPSATAAPAPQGPGVPPPPASLALAPAQLLPTFARAAQLTGVPQEVLLAIARVESGFDPRAVGPYLPQFAGTEDQHALGMMQFLPSSYRPHIGRVDAATGKGLGLGGIWDAESSIYAAAFYLGDNGAPGDLRRAIFAYNHAGWYVDLILSWAAYYAGGAMPDTGWTDPGRPTMPDVRAAPQNPLLPSNGRHLDLTAPIRLYAPWTAGQTWHAGGEGAFYGDGYHHDAFGAHYAVDFNKGVYPNTVEDEGEPVLAAADGIVNNIYQDAAGGWVVELYHLAPDGAQLRTLYLHLKTDPRVAPGIAPNQPVLHGTPIGLVGNTGNSTGPHLHFGLWLLKDGSWVSIRPEPLEGQFLSNGANITSTNAPVGLSMTTGAGAPRELGHGFAPAGPSNADTVTIFASARGAARLARRIEVYVNTAPDGSERGRWVAVGAVDGELGQVDWQAAPVADGTYRVLFAIVDQDDGRFFHGLTGETAMRYTVRRGDFRGSAVINPRADLTFLASLDGTTLAQLGPRSPVVSGPLRFVPQGGVPDNAVDVSPRARPPSAMATPPAGYPPGASASPAATPTRGHAAGKLSETTGLLVEEGTTNLVPNPSFERDLAGWTVRDAPGGALTVTPIDGGRFGQHAVRLDNRDGTGEAAFFTVAGDGKTAAWSVYVRSAERDHGRGRERVPAGVGLGMSGLAPRTFDLTPEWSRIQIVGAGGDAGAERRIIVPAGGIVELDAAQLEAKASVTSYADGSLGPGYGWDHVADASLSGRLATVLQAPIEGVLAAERGTIGFWATPQGPAGEGAQLLNLGDRLTILIGEGAALRWGEEIVATARWERGVTRHYALTWEDGTLTFLQDGQVVGSLKVDDFAIPADAGLTVGSDPSGARSSNAVIQDLAVWNVSLPTALATIARGQRFVLPGALRVERYTVTVALAVQGVAPVEMAFSFDGQTWTEPEPFAPTKTLVLPNGTGPRRVFVHYTDKEGRTVVVVDSVLVLAPSRRPFDLGDTLYLP